MRRGAACRKRLGQGNHILNRIYVALAAGAALLASPALADSITSVNGTAVTSINEASVSASASFGPTAITGGKANFIGVTSTGASVNVEILKDGVDEGVPTNDSLAVSTITTQNSGTVTATGSFNGSSLVSTTGNGNSTGVSAAGTSVNISIIKR
jgi:hypothetical protein